MRRVKQGSKDIVTPLMVCEELSLTYVGLIEGHNILELQTIRTQAKNYYLKPAFVYIGTRLCSKEVA